MALIEAKSLIRLSRMRVMFPVDTETNEHSCEVGPFGEGSSKGPETAIIEPPDLHLPAACLRAGVLVLKPRTVDPEQTAHAAETLSTTSEE